MSVPLIILLARRLVKVAQHHTLNMVNDLALTFATPRLGLPILVGRPHVKESSLN